MLYMLYDPMKVEPVPEPTLADVSNTLRRHPRLLWDLLAELQGDRPPLIAGPWRGASRSRWRCDPLKRKVATVAPNPYTPRRWWYSVGGHSTQNFDTREEAKTSADAWLIANGWTLFDD